MNRDDILAMEPGRELDKLCAEVIFKVTDPDKRWSPSTDIAAAWEVVMTFDVNTFNLNWLDRNSIFGEGWHCKLGSSHAHMCATAPEAICKAALLAVLDL